MIILPEDLEIYSYNTGSSWFPNLNGVTLKHKPSGLEASCGTERSLHKNRDIAYKELCAKVEAFKPILIQQFDPTEMIRSLRSLADALELKIYGYESGGMLITEYNFFKSVEIKSDLILKKL